MKPTLPVRLVSCLLIAGLSARENRCMRPWDIPRPHQALPDGGREVGEFDRYCNGR